MLNPSNFGIKKMRSQSLPFRWLNHIHAQRGIVAQSVHFAFANVDKEVKFHSTSQSTHFFEHVKMQYAL